MSNQPKPILPLPLHRLTIRQLSQLPIIDLAALDPLKRQAEEARRRALLAQAAQMATKEPEHA